jgi:FdhD protein
MRLAPALDEQDSARTHIVVIIGALEPSLIRQFSVKRFRNAQSERIIDTVAAEEPLEIRVRYWTKDAQVSDSLALTMRTPGHDCELAAGFLLSEGIIRERGQIVDLRQLGTNPSNEIAVELARGVELEKWRLARSTFINSACGVCGKRSRDALAQELPERRGDGFRLNASSIETLPALLRNCQQGFAKTGGLHAAALVDSCGRIEKVFEDIGRHNALDKLLGWCVLNDRIPLADRLLFLSSRSSFELIQKTVMAGAPVLATVGAPSSLAIEAAREYGVTLIGFVRETRFNIYAGDWRINS